MDVTGFYFVLINDSRTEITQSPSWFVSVTGKYSHLTCHVTSHVICYCFISCHLYNLCLSSHLVPMELISFDTPNSCLLQNTVSRFTCIVRGLPEPSITFLKNNALLPCISCSTTNSITAITTSILEVNATSSDVGGDYHCRANGIDSNVLSRVFCSK